MTDTLSSAIPLIIVGMHRSGTSLTASLLQSAGMHVGDRLMPPAESNPKGFFENLDFYEFHKAVLRSQGVNTDGWTLQESIEVEDFYVDEAKKLIERNAQPTGVWGWKDPRTTLFLDFWAELLPEARFLMVYRSPWEVVDSLYRRGDIVFQEYPLLAVKCWEHYNQKNLGFLKRFSERCLLVSFEALIQHPDLLITELNERYALELSAPDKSRIDVRLLNHSEVDAYRPSLIKHHFPQVVQTYEVLESFAWRSANSVENADWRSRIGASLYQNWPFKDWIEIRSHERKSKVNEMVLQQKNAQIQQLELKLKNLQSKIEEMVAQDKHI